MPTMEDRIAGARRHAVELVGDGHVSEYGTARHGLPLLDLTAGGGEP